MIKGLYITSILPYAGKNMLAVGIGLRFQKEGLSIGYMKPFGVPREEDAVNSGDDDARFVLDVLGLDSPLELVSPILETHDFRMRAFAGKEPDHMGKIVQTYETLSAGRDLMLVAGTGHSLTGKYCGLDGLRIAKELGLKTVIIDRPAPEVHYDRLLGLKEQLGDSLAGVILNDVSPSFAGEMESVISPFLSRCGIPILGLVPHDTLMGSIRARELAERLGGRLIASQGKADGLVENFLIGTMQVENFMTYFRRHPHAAVIVGGDRADVQLVAIEGDCPCLVLTGNLFPNDIILSRADTLGVPIIMVRDDTYTVAKKMEMLLSRHKMRDVMKVRQGSQLISNHLDFATLRAGLGV